MNLQVNVIERKEARTFGELDRSMAEVLDHRILPD